MAESAGDTNDSGSNGLDEIGSVLIVIPVFNEADRLAEVIEVARLFGPVLAVDDGSADGSAEVAQVAGADVLRHSQNEGKGKALETGFAEAVARGVEWVVTLDGDGQHDPPEIANLLAARGKGWDVILGNRMGEVSAMPRVRRITNRFMSIWLSRMMVQWVPDTQTGFRCVRTRLVSGAMPEAKRFAAESEWLLMWSRGGARIGSVPVRTIYNGKRGESSIRPFRDTFRFLGMVWRMRKE